MTVTPFKNVRIAKLFQTSSSTNDTRTPVTTLTMTADIDKILKK